MNARERFIETMTFGRPDRPAAGDYFAYASTRERWEREGLPKDVDLNAYFGMDVIAARKRYGRAIGFHGGIDKRALAGTRADIRAEVVPKLEAAFGEGGFIPACDHGIPPDISFDNYRYFRELIREYSER